MSIIDFIAVDLKISIDDLIHELKKMEKDIKIIKDKLKIDDEES